MRENQHEVVLIRRFFSIFFLMVLLIVLSPRAEAAAKIKAGAVTTAVGSLNVRAQPTSAAPAVTSLKKGSYMVAIILCSGIEDITPQLAAMFYALDN